MADVSKRAALISAKELPKLIDAALAGPGDHGAVSTALVKKWDLVGRVMKDMKAADAFSTSVAGHLNASGHSVSAAVLKVDGRILAGFYERVAIPQIKEF